MITRCLVSTQHTTSSESRKKSANNTKFLLPSLCNNAPSVHCFAEKHNIVENVFEIKFLGENLLMGKTYYYKVPVSIHAKSGRYLRYISAIFFGFSAKF